MNERAKDVLRVQLMGPPSWRSASADGRLEKKFAALVAYVSVNGRVATDAVARLVWAGDPPALARSSLRTHVLRLRKATGHPVFDQGDAIECMPNVEVDLSERLEDWSTDQLLERSEFLAGIEITGNKAANDWIARQRRHWYERVCEALLQRRAQLAAPHAARPALHLASRISESTPSLESAWRLRMWLHFVAGDHAAAVDAWRRLVEQLGPLGGIPGPQTMEIWRLIERGATAPLPTPDARQGLAHPPVLIGRELQWAGMAESWAAGRPFLLAGEGGIGKSRLLRDFVARNGPSIVINARKGDEQAPYATLGTLLRAVIDEWELALEPAVRRQVAYALRELGRTEGRPPADQLRLWRAVETVLGQASAGGVRCVAVDDLQQIDLASLQALRWLASDSTRAQLRFAFASRPAPVDARQELLTEWRLESMPLYVIEMTPWTDGDVEELLWTLNLGGAAAGTSAAELRAWTGGVPFLVLDTLDERVNGRLASRDAATAPDAVEHRVRTVSAAAKPLLQLHAVLDRRIEDAAAALGRTAAEAAATVAELESHGALREGRFVHDLMRDAVLRALTAAERKRWHALAAHALKSDPRVPRAIIANAWEVAERWPEAALEYHAAGLDARDAGRLEESRSLLEKASTCYGLAGDPAGRFDASHDAFDGELDVQGPESAQKLVDRLAGWTNTEEQRARVAILNAKVAVGRQRLDGSALALATTAMALAESYPILHGAALTVQAVGFAQAGDFARAIDAGKRALALSEQDGQASQARENASNLVYVYFQANRVGDAIALARELVGRFEAVGDLASAGSMEGSLASLLLLAGDPAGTIGPAFRSHERHREIEVTASGPLAVNNRAVLGPAYAHVGRFGEALSVLLEGGDAMFARIPPFMAAKVRLTRAHVWLVLGADEAAVSALGPADESWVPSMQVHRHAALARLAEIRGEDPAPQFQRMAELQAAHPDIPLMHAPWLEWSRIGDAREVADEMADIAQACSDGGRPGAARTALLRRVARLNEIDDSATISDAAVLARELSPHLTDGLQAWVYLPDAWQTLSIALIRAGDDAAAEECLAAARHWILQVALPNVPPSLREGFLRRNPVNRALVGAP